VQQLAIGSKVVLFDAPGLEGHTSGMLQVIEPAVQQNRSIKFRILASWPPATQYSLGRITVSRVVQPCA
jgi:hypothetical protein